MNKNNNYKYYVTKVFSFFEGKKVGEGLLLFEVLMDNRPKYSATEYRLMLFTIYNLVEQDYLAYKEGGLVVLTQDGYDYMQGDYMPNNKVNFNQLVSPKKSAQERFDDLWLLIGKEDSALFYVTGPCFYNAIKPYLNNLHGDYSDYMSELRDKEKSTSRSKWYRELYCQLSDEYSGLFLNDLSKEVEIYYSDAEDGGNFEDSLFALYDEDIEKNVQNADILKDNVPKQPKKKIFISYSWEDEEHNKWVHHLAKLLEEKFDVKIDVKQPLGIELNQFMEQMIAKSDKVLIITTPIYKYRANNRIKGVGYETSLITNDMVSDQNKIKFIPIIRKGSKEDSYPNYLGNRKGLDMKDDAKYEDNLKELISNLEKY